MKEELIQKALAFINERAGAYHVDVCRHLGGPDTGTGWVGSGALKRLRERGLIRRDETRRPRSFWLPASLED